jgi:hypothetical protein
MLNAWFYSNPNWLVVVVVCTVLVALGLGAVLLTQRFVDWEKREKDTKIVGLSYALAGGIYAIVISFVAVGVYEAMDKASAVATAEANSLSSLMFDSAGLPPALAAQVRADTSAYIETVTKKEWPAQQAFKMDDRNFELGWTQVRRISQDLATYQPTTPGQETMKLEMVGNVDGLFSQRRSRILAASAHLPDAIWQMAIAGLVMVVAYLCLFGPHNAWMHLVTVGLSVGAIGLIFSLIIALDYPFRGGLSVSDEAYVSAKDLSEELFPAKPPPPGEAKVAPANAEVAPANAEVAAKKS